MTTIINCATCDANQTSLVQIESSFARGFTGLHLIGNTAEVCRDGKERAKTALESLGIYIPPRRLIVSLTPADLRKDGSQFDLPLAVSLAILICERPALIDPRRWLFVAELGLGGELRPVKGMVSFALEAISKGLHGVVVPEASLKELKVLTTLNLAGMDHLQVIGFRSLAQVLAWVFEGAPGTTYSETPLDHVDWAREAPNFDDMLLTPDLCTLATAVAAGEHSVLLRGTPGCGKSMFAMRLRSILDPMNRLQHLDALKLASSYTPTIPESLLAGRPPLRHPHHQASAAAVLGSHERPGEISMAHGGVLFLDELPEFRRDLLEGLREPLENGAVSVSRSRQKVIWKSQVLLVAACNNCPCGWLGSHRKSCRCQLPAIRAYKSRLSGPILDRIDIHFNMPETLEHEAGLMGLLSENRQQSNTLLLSEKVRTARKFAEKRNTALGATVNRTLPPHTLAAASRLPEKSFINLIEKISSGVQMTRRSLFRAVRVARTLADLAGSDAIREDDLSLAVSWQAEASARSRGEHLMGI